MGVSRLVWLGLSASAALVGAELWAGTHRLKVLQYQVAVPGLPADWEGVRIAHLSDFHAGARGTPVTLLERAKAAALAFKPDLIALTGDYYDNGQAVEVGTLWGGWPEKCTIVAVLGNHDFRGPPDAPMGVAGELEAGGIAVLRNAALRTELRGRPAWIVGVDDPFTWRADESAAFAGVPASEDVLLYLAHSPSIDATIPPGRASIALSGHTHGGQVRVLPSGRIPLVRLLRRMRGTPERRDPVVYRGVHWLRGTLVFVSEGIGVSRLPLRFRTRPHVILLELTQGAATGPACDDPRRYVRRMGPRRSRLVLRYNLLRQSSAAER